MTATTLLLATILSLPTNVLVLRSGDRIAVGEVRQEEGTIYFTTPDGRLFSVPAEEVDAAASQAARASRSRITELDPEPEKPLASLRLRGSEAERKRLLDALEQNHVGVAVPLRPITLSSDSSSREERAEEEWTWRKRAQGLEEAVRQAKENRDLLTKRAEELKQHITGLLSLGYKPVQFSYDTTMLQYTLEQIPQAELEITRAERALAQFREEARKRDIPPGWLR